MTKYADQITVRDAYRAAYAAELRLGLDALEKDGYTEKDFYGTSVADLVERSIMASDDDTGENSQGGYVTISYERGLSSPYYGDPEIMFRIDAAAKEFIKRGDYFTELVNGGVGAVYAA